MTIRPTAIVDVDGLNLYYRLLMAHPHARWLNLLALAEMLVPTHEIKLVHYFTARVLPGVTDPQAPKRQEEYWRALRTLGGKIAFHLERMEARDRMFLAVPRSIDESVLPRKVKVKLTEEKGSDVALASQMVFEAASRKADLFVLITTDSDFVPAIRLIQEDLKMPVGFISPSERPSEALKSCSPLFTKTIRLSALEACVFPDTLHDTKGPIIKSVNWAIK